jgi:hypothetical protein
MLNEELKKKSFLPVDHDPNVAAILQVAAISCIERVRRCWKLPQPEGLRRQV